MLELKKQRFPIAKKSIHQRQRRRRALKRTLIAVSILLLLIIGAALVYVWYMGQNSAESAVQKPVNTGSLAPKLKAPQIADDAPVGIVQQTFSSEVAGGGNAMISIKTNPKAACQIAVKVNKTSLPDSGLVPKIADEFGMVDWSWTVPKGIVAGEWPVEITCANQSGRSAYYKARLQVE